MANAAQSNYKSEPDKINERDQFGTPAYATNILVPWLKRAGVKVIWESACGKHHFIYNHLSDHGFTVIETDLLHGPQFNRFTVSPPFRFDAEVTNPPYGRGVKFPWCEIAFNMPEIVCLLLPTAFIETKTGQGMMKKHSLQVIVPDDRIDFHTPFKGWDSSAQFHSSWFCKGLGLPDQFNFVDMYKPKKGRKKAVKRPVMGIPVKELLKR